LHNNTGLPDEAGRKDIFQIHTKKMKDNDALAPDVDLAHLAVLSKNFSGAEIAGLCRSAVSFAMNRCVTTDGGVKIDEDVMNSLKVCTMALQASRRQPCDTGQSNRATHATQVDMDDFTHALSEVQPAFGVSVEEVGEELQIRTE